MLEAGAFHWLVRVYYEDTDHGGVVYHANFLKFMERARSEWLRAKGIEQDVLINEQGVIFAVRSMQLDFIKPARFNQQLAVKVVPLKIGKASMLIEHEIFQVNNKQEGEPGVLSDQVALCRAQVKIACLDAQTLKPKAIPVLLEKEILGDD